VALLKIGGAARYGWLSDANTPYARGMVAKSSRDRSVLGVAAQAQRSLMQHFGTPFPLSIRFGFKYRRLNHG